jgi:short-subunit dehydrogenase
MNRGKAVLAAGAAVAAIGVVGMVGAGTAAAMLVRRRFRPRSLDGQVVLITGASRGLGLALAETFGRRGAKLVMVARDPWKLEQARTLLVQRGAVREEDVLVIPADLRRQDEAEQAVARAREHFGRIDVLVNNAGVITVGPVENQTAQDFHDVMEANFFTGVHCALAVVPKMLARGSGTIVNIASIGGKLAVPHLLPYTASKFAVVGFSEGLHAELRAKGVHVLTVCPGLMRTGSHVSAHFSGDQEREYRWFSLAANLPGVSTSAACAARRIVRAVQCRETEIAITPQAIVASRLAHLAPEIVVRAMSAVNRVLPDPAPASNGQQRGAEVRGREMQPARTIGDAAARRYNQTA